MRISIDEATKLLNSGKVIGVPTETVYGLAASLQYPQAIQEIYKIKGRPANNPLIIHVSSFREVCSYLQENICDLDILARDFWPGPMTIVLPVKCKLIPSIARADLPTAAFRIPKHPLAVELLKLTGSLVMPSANLSGSPSSTQPEHVENDLGIDFPILDGGRCKRGLESTILIQADGKWKIVRQGALAPEHFVPTLGYKPSVQDDAKNGIPVCPGQMYRHYAPKAKLELVNSFENIEEGVIIGFSDRTYPKNCNLMTLGPLSNMDIVASNLYAVLRQLDLEGHPKAYVDMNFPKTGILATLAERFHKAAAAN